MPGVHPPPEIMPLHAAFLQEKEEQRQREEEEQQERILTYIQESCTERKEICEVWEYNGNMMVQAEKTLKIGGATVFISEVNQIMKF